jgi:hypothetical protein
VQLNSTAASFANVTGAASLGGTVQAVFAPGNVAKSRTHGCGSPKRHDRMKSARVGILILILIICGAVKPSSTENLVASGATAAGPKPPEHAAKVKGANEVNRRLMALSEEDRRSVFRRILALAKERCVEITRTFYQQQAKQWNVRCRGGRLEKRTLDQTAGWSRSSQ